MTKAIVIGSGIAGMTCAVSLAEQGVHVCIVAPCPPERAQSVMAAGGINAVMADCEKGDSLECHVEETLRAGRHLAGSNVVRALCEHAPDVIAYLERIGTVFSLDGQGRLAKRAFGGQSYRRTHYCGTATGKLIVSALAMEVRRFEAAGLIRRVYRHHFHSALIHEGVCYGALLFDAARGKLVVETADALVMATGGLNGLFGKTTGSVLCDGYAAGKLCTQGVALKNLEFVQYHPTTIDAGQKRMLVSEVARGEGGRLFYEEEGKRVYFLEEAYGQRGNLVTRDVASKEIAATGKDVFLDVSFLGEAVIQEKLPEVREVCLKFRNIDIAKQPVPVAPAVHFFMGGIAVRNNHETNVERLFAVGECASMYHGANRLGGNSLLAAVYGAQVAAREIALRQAVAQEVDFSAFVGEQERALLKQEESLSVFPAMYVRDMVAESVVKCMGIVRDGAALDQGISDIDYYLSIVQHLCYDKSVSAYTNYSLDGILPLAKALLLSAQQRTESRGAHCRSDFPDEDESQAFASIVTYDGERLQVCLDKERAYEN